MNARATAVMQPQPTQPPLKEATKKKALVDAGLQAKFRRLVKENNDNISEAFRILLKEGYPVNTIAKASGRRYQFVRNVKKTMEEKEERRQFEEDLARRKAAKREAQLDKLANINQGGNQR